MRARFVSTAFQCRPVSGRETQTWSEDAPREYAIIPPEGWREPTTVSMLNAALVTAKLLSDSTFSYAGSTLRSANTLYPQIVTSERGKNSCSSSYVKKVKNVLKVMTTHAFL